MYNASRKEEFIEFKKQDTVSSEEKGSWYFNRVEKIEEYLGKDVCDFTTVEIVNYLKSISTPSVEYLYGVNNYLSQYARWCLGKGYIKDGQNHFEEVTKDVMAGICVNSAMIKNRIMTKSTIMDILNDIVEPCDKFLFLAIFEGLGGVKYKELWNLTMDNFEGEYVTLCTGRRLKVSSKLVELAKLSSETYESKLSASKFKKGDNRILKARTNTKDIETPPQMYRRIWLQLDRINKDYKNTISAKGLRDSGRIELIKELRKDGETIEDTYIENRKEIESRYGVIRYISEWVDQYSWAFE